MSTLTGPGLPLPPVNAPVAPDVQVDATEAVPQGVPAPAPGGPGNSSGLLQDFILPKTTLDALGLLRPSNQGDSEIGISQAFLKSEELAEDSEGAQAQALSAFASGQAAAIRAFFERVAALEAENENARGQIAGNTNDIRGLDREIGQINGDIAGLEAEQQALRDQIAASEDPNEIAALQDQVAAIDGQVAALQSSLGDLEGARDGLVAENNRLEAEISTREGAISAQQQLQVLVLAILDQAVAAQTGSNEAIEDVQKQGALETGEVVLEEALPNMQQIFEIDLEDLSIENMIADGEITEAEAQKAIAVSYGLAGSFYEALGLFLQLSNLGELDLNSTALGNNKTQRMQIAV